MVPRFMTYSRRAYFSTQPSKLIRSKVRLYLHSFRFKLGQGTLTPIQPRSAQGHRPPRVRSSSMLSAAPLLRQPPLSVCPPWSWPLFQSHQRLCWSHLVVSLHCFSAYVGKKLHSTFEVRGSASERRKLPHFAILPK